MCESFIKAEDIIKYFEKNDTFSFEMEILKATIEENFECEHGGTYIDPITDKNRQFDIRAKKTRGNNIIKIAVECKKLNQTNPLIVSQIKRKREESFYEIIETFPPRLEKTDSKDTIDVMGISSYALPITISNKIHINKENQSFLYMPNKYVGKSMTQIGKKLKNNKKENIKEFDIKGNDSEIFDRWSQAVASSYDLIDSTINMRKSINSKTIIIPILVIPNNTLWSIEYNEKGSLIGVPKKINECDFFINKVVESRANKFKMLTISHLNIYTMNGYINFLKNFHNNNTDWWHDLFHIYE